MLYPFETHFILSMWPKLLLPLFVWNLISCRASPWCPNSHDLPGQLRADAALLKYLLSAQVPMCFPNHSSLQLWKWALIHPRSVYCFNVSVETCARELFFFFYKQNPDPKQTLMAVFAVGLPLQQNKWQLDTFCSRHTSTVLANTTFQLGLFTLSIKSLAVSVVFGSGYSFVNKEFYKCEIFRWLSVSIMQSFRWCSEECKVSSCMLAFKEWGGCSMTLFYNLVFGCAKVSCSLKVCFHSETLWILSWPIRPMFEETDSINGILTLLCTQKWMVNSAFLSNPCISACDPVNCWQRDAPGDVRHSELDEDVTA